MKNLYLSNFSMNFSAAWHKGQCLMKQTFLLCLLGLFFNLTTISAQAPCVDGSIIACAGTMIDISAIGDSDMCSFTADCAGLSTEFLVVSSEYDGVADTAILGTEQSLEFDASKYMVDGVEACINVVPICYDLTALQDLVDNMNQNDTCCFFLNLITEQVAPPGTDSICNVIKDVLGYTSGDQIQSMAEVLDIIEVFGGEGLTLNSLQAVIDGVNAQVDFIANFCTQSREIAYCMNPDIDFTQNAYALVNPIPADPITIVESSCPTCPDTESLAGYEPDGSSGSWTGGFVSPAGEYTTCGIGAGGQDFVYTYMHEDVNGCMSENTVTVTVVIFDVAPLTFDTDEVIVCDNGGDINLADVAVPSMTGGDCAWGSPADANGIVGVAGLDGDYLVEYTCTSADGCVVSGAITLTVNILATVEFPDTEICPNIATNLNDVLSPSFNGTWGEPTDTDGNIDGTAYEPNDEFDVTYDYIDGDGCNGSTTVHIIVTDLEINGFANNPLNLCAGQGLVDLTTAAGPSIPDGTWSGTGVMNGDFDANVAEGTYTVTYSWTEDGFGCPGSDDLEIIVSASPGATLDPVGVCPGSIYDMNVTATLPVAGGTWGGAVTMDGGFNAETPGDYAATYTYSDGTCAVIGNITITVYSVETLTFDNTTICYGGTFNLDDIVWTSIGGGTWSGDDIVDGTLDATVPGDYNVTYTYTDGNGCAGEAMTTLTVMQVMAGAALDTIDICSFYPINLGAMVPMAVAGGYWGGVAAIDGYFNPADVTPGFYTAQYYYMDNGTCLGVEDVVLNVRVIEPTGLTPDTLDLCQLSGITHLNSVYGSLPNGGTWAGAVSADGIFTARDFAPDNYDVSYIYADEEVCRGTEIVLDIRAAVSSGITDVAILQEDLPVDLNVLTDPFTAEGSANLWLGCVDLDGAGMFEGDMGVGLYPTSLIYYDSTGCKGNDSIGVYVTASVGAVDSTELCFIPTNEALPIAFISFTGTHKNESNQLNWAVSTDMKVKDFVVQRSSDGTVFEAIHQVEMVDFNIGSGYFSFEDNDLRSAVNYYRILGVDENGTESYSKIIALESDRVTIKEALAVVPNPLTDQVQINFLTATEGTVSFAIVNAVGLQVASFVENTKDGQNSFSHDLSTLESGIYFLIANVQDRTVVTKILKY